MGHETTSNLANLKSPFINKILRIKKILEDHISFPGGVRIFHRAISLQGPPNGLTFPVCFVQPGPWLPKLSSNTKVDAWGQVTIYVYVTGNDPDAVGADALTNMAMLDRLFSNNALDDLQTSGRTDQFFRVADSAAEARDGWIQSEWGPLEPSPALNFQREKSEEFMIGIRGVFKFNDVYITQ